MMSDIVARNNLRVLFENFQSSGCDSQGFVPRFVELLLSPEESAQRDHFSPGHLTGSAWVVNRAGTKVLLLHHGKLNRWLQPGGHADGDFDLASVALREAQEESGLSSLVLLHPHIFDLDIHEIPPHKSEPAHLHFDARFILQADESEPLVLSEESNALAWVELSKLSQFTQEESVLRMRRRWEAANQHLFSRFSGPHAS
jgi:8-oxo-dGTP pyrophosphatase MutT (NUDIX family)